MTVSVDELPDAYRREKSDGQYVWSRPLGQHGTDGCAFLHAISWSRCRNAIMPSTFMASSMSSASPLRRRV
jgi:hypothetical protein